MPTARKPEPFAICALRVFHLPLPRSARATRSIMSISTLHSSYPHLIHS